MYELRFDDGEFIGEYDNLDDLQKQLDYVFHQYISRYAIPYKDGKKISISEERKKLESNSSTQNSINKVVENFGNELEKFTGMKPEIKDNSSLPEYPKGSYNFKVTKSEISGLKSKLNKYLRQQFKDRDSSYVIERDTGDELIVGVIDFEGKFNSRTQNSIDWNRLKNFDFRLDEDPGVYLVIKSPERFAKNVIDALNSGKTWDYNVFKGIEDDIVGFIDVHEYLDALDSGKLSTDSIFFEEVDRACGEEGELLDFMEDNDMVIPVGNYQVTGITTEKELDKFNKKYPRYAAKIEVPSDMGMNSRKYNSNMEFKFDPNKYYIVQGSRFQGKIGIGFVNGPYNTESDAVKVLNDKFGSIRKDIGIENDFVSVVPGNFVEKYDPNKSSYYTSDVDKMAKDWREFVDANYDNNSKSNLNKSITTNSKKMKKIRIKSRNYNSRRGRVRKFNSVVDLVGQEVEIAENDEVMEGTVESVEVNKDNEVTVELDGGDKVILEPSEAAELIDKGEVVTETEEITPTEINCNEYKIARNCTYKNGKKVRKVASVTAPTLEEAIAAVETKDKSDDIEAEGYEELVEQLPEKSTVTINSDIEEEILLEPGTSEVVEETTPETPMEPEVVEETTPETPMEPEVVEELEDRQSNSYKGVADYVKRAYGIDLK